MKYVILSLLILSGCTDKKEKLSTSRSDIEMARCICQQRNLTLHNATRDNDELYLYCSDGRRLLHQDSTYTEGCTK